MLAQVTIRSVDGVAARRPAVFGWGLARAVVVGIDDLVNPAATNAHIFARGRLRPLPAGHLLGIPTDLGELEASGLVSDEALDSLRNRQPRDWAPPSEDVSVASGPGLGHRLGSVLLELVNDAAQ
jgi:oxygen-dependent protoporphyrinogen oxidase